MRERVFVARHEAVWKDLEELLSRADRGGLRTFTPEELRRLALRYRATTGDLAAAQSRAYTDDLRSYLNRLTARAHAYVYASTARGGLHRLIRVVTWSFPREFRRSGRIIGAVSLLFVLCAIGSYAAVMQRPASAYTILGPDNVQPITKSLHDSNFLHPATDSPAMSSTIITHNIEVTAASFAGGMTLGIVTIALVVFNGLMVGVLGALFTQHGFGPDFWATIAPHGVYELTAIQIGAAGGLLIAQAILAPGRMRRADALRAAAGRAGMLMIGAALMLCVAGTFEGFFTPRRTSIDVRASVGILNAIVLTLYLTLAGRGPGKGSYGRSEFG